MTTTEAILDCMKKMNELQLVMNAALAKCSEIDDFDRAMSKYSDLKYRIGECIQCIERFIDDLDRPQGESKPLSPLLQWWADQYIKSMIDDEIKEVANAGSDGKGGRRKIKIITYTNGDHTKHSDD